ncbi:MAG: tetratricopeptide repeat protein, partial [Bacillota bacterium]
MQFINTQYKIISLEKEDKYGSVYLVEDTSRNNLIKMMRVFGVQKETLDFIEYIKCNLYDYKNFNHINLTETYFFNKIVAIDGKPVVADKYYITSEHIHGENLFEYIKHADFEEILDIAIQLCQVVKYLHLRGYLLCNVNTDELLVTEENDIKTLKVLSLPFIRGTASSNMLYKDNNNFKSPEVLQDENYTIQSDIYLIGVILFYMFSRENVNNSHFREALSHFKIASDNNRLVHIFDIIKKCTELKPADRYLSVDEIVDDINLGFHKAYKTIDKRYLQVLPRYMTKLVSRENYIKKIINNTKGYYFENKKNSITVIKGGIGTGKTTLLTALGYRLQQEGFCVIMEKLNENLCTSFFIISYVIRDIMKHIDKELIDKYASDLIKLIPELSVDKVSQSVSSPIDGDSKMRLIYRIGNFLLEAAIKYPFILAINNFNWVDEDSEEVLNYILRNESKGKIYFIVTIESDAIEEKIRYNQLYGRLAEEGYLDTIELGNFNINETAEYIRLLLGMDKAPLDFAANIYKETEGNPNYIYEVIYLLYINNFIFVDDNGEWVLNNIDFNNIKLSINIDEIVLNKINRLTPMQKETIKVMSVFNTAISTDILEKMLDIKGEELFNHLNYLASINILSRKVDDWGISFDFSSLNLKKSIYERITGDEKLMYHEKVSYILEKKFEKENRENKDELIYHMTKANRYDEAIEHLMSSAEKMISSNLINQAIQFLEQSLQLFDKCEVNQNKIVVCLKLGDLYEQLGEFNRAAYFYDIVENIAEALADKKILVDIYIKKFTLLYRLNDIKNCLKYAVGAKRLLKNFYYEEGLYDLVISLSEIAVNRRKYVSYGKILEKLLSDENVKQSKFHYSRLLMVYGRNLYFKNRYEESLKVTLESVEIMEALGIYKYLPAALNSIGVIYTDYYNDIHKSREYYEKSLSISQKINDLRTISNCYNNLAEIYRMEDKYTETLEYYNKALEVVHITHNALLHTLLHENLILVYISMEDYKKTVENIKLTEKLLKRLKDTSNLTEYYYRSIAEFYYVMGDYDLAKDYSQKAVDMCISWDVSVDPEAEYVNILAETQQSGKLDYDRHMEFCERTFSDNLYKLGRITCIRFAEIYADKGMHEQAESFLELGRKYIE